jgi:hypothetical protein
MNLYHNNTPAEKQNPVTFSAQLSPAPEMPAPGLKCTWTPANPGYWTVIPDDAPPAKTALPFEFNATLIASIDPARLTLTRFTAINPTRLSKAFSLKAGKLVKQPGGNLIDGRADRIEVDLAGMTELLATLGPQHALGYGVTQANSARVVTRDQYDRMAAHCETEDADVVARTREHFAWPATPGILMLDYDPPATGPALTRKQLLSALADAAPGLATAAAIWRPSASSCIYTSDGQELRGIAGQRVYIPIQDARDIPRAGQALADRLWLGGHGRIDLSASGAMLERTIIDTAVWQPERLDFAGGAECAPGLQQRLPAPVVTNQDAGYLDTRQTLPDLTGRERAALANLKEAARAALKPQADSAREIWIGERVKAAVKRLPKDQREDAQHRIERAYREAADGGALGPDVIIHINGMGERTVSQILAQPTKYHGKTCRDPLEPDYQGGKMVGWINTRSATPCIRSQAHGGIRYRLIAQVQEPAAPLATKKNINRDLNILASVRPTQATATAVAIAQRYAGDSPRHRTLDGLATSIRHTMTGQPPSVISAAMTAVDRQLAGYQRHALAQATAAIRLSFGTPAADMRELVNTAMNAPRGTILLVKAPQGAGKTQELLKPVAAAMGGTTTVIAVSAKVSLVADLATRLELTDYKAAKTGDLESSTGLAICINSLCNPKFSEILHRQNTVLLIDEIDRVLAELHNPNGTMGKQGRAVFDALTRLMQNARLVIGVDADLNNQTVQTISAMRRPDQNLVIHTVESRWALPAIRFGEDKQIWSEICSAVQNNEKVLITSDSAGTVIRLAKFLKAISKDKKIVEIQSRHGVATTGDPAIVKLLQDINSGIADIDVLVCSPAVESGISITTPHFTRHFALYQGVIAPSQIVQQMRRDRTASTITLGFCGNLIRNDPTDPGAILANLDSAHRQTITSSRAAGDGYEVTALPATDYDRRVTQYLAGEATAKNHAGRNLLLMLEALGYHTERLDCTVPEIATADLARARDLEIAAEQLAIQTAPDITETEREQIKQDYQPTPAESAAACRYDIRQTTGKVDEFVEIEDGDLRAWRNGKLVGEASRFDALAGDPDAAAIDAQDEANEVTLAARSHRQSLVECSRALFEAAGLEPNTGAGTVTNATALAAWTALAGTDNARALERHRVCRFEKKPPAYPVRWLNQALNKFGLDLEAGAQIVRAHMPGKDEVLRPHVCVDAGQARERTYTIRRDPSMDKAGVRMTHPGWNLMQQYHEARMALPRREFQRPVNVDIDIDAVIRNARTRRAQADL